MTTESIFDSYLLRWPDSWIYFALAGQLDWWIAVTLAGQLLFWPNSCCSNQTAITLTEQLLLWPETWKAIALEGKLDCFCAI